MGYPEAAYRRDPMIDLGGDPRGDPFGKSGGMNSNQPREEGASRPKPKNDEDLYRGAPPVLDRRAKAIISACPLTGMASIRLMRASRRDLRDGRLPDASSLNSLRSAHDPAIVSMTRSMNRERGASPGDDRFHQE